MSGDYTVQATYNDCLNITDGEKGVSLIALPNIPFIGNFNKLDIGPWYWLALLIIIVAVIFNRRLEDSRLGRAWMAVREDEVAAAAMGIDTVKVKLFAFAIGASFSGIGGVVYSSKLGLVTPDNFRFTTSAFILSMAIVMWMGVPFGFTHCLLR